MEWKDIGEAVGKAAPILGTLIAGAPGAAIGSLIASTLGVEPTPDAVAAELKANPEAAIKLAQIEKDRQVELQGMLLDHAKAEMQAVVATTDAVNKTMQAEAASERWPQWSWRPAIGFSVAINLILSALIVLAAYVGVMLGGAKPEVLQYLPPMLAAMAGLVAVASPILGIASWFRGKMQADPAIPPAQKV